VGDHDATHNPTSEIRRETPFFVPTLLDRHQSGINPLEQEVAKSDIRPVRAPNGVRGSLYSARRVGFSSSGRAFRVPREQSVVTTASVKRELRYSYHAFGLYSFEYALSEPARYFQVIRPFVARGSNGLPFAHNRSHGSRRYRAADGDIAGRCERTGGGGEGRHRQQCRRSPPTRERCVAKAQRTTSFQHTPPAPPY
jgi:hypothetical protein